MEPNEQPDQRRRRIDRITAPEFLEGLEQRDVAELRAMRDDCSEEEARFSYNRRLLQGRIDIVKAELDRRTGRASGSLIEALPSILADEPGPRAGVADSRNAPVYQPDDEVGRRSDDRMAADALLARLPDLTEPQLEQELAELQEEERRVSELRRSVLACFDAIQTELVRRYREGGVDSALSAI
jgi:hypothetical protein